MSSTDDSVLPVADAVDSGAGVTPWPTPFPRPTPGAPAETAGNVGADAPGGPPSTPGSSPSLRDGAPESASIGGGTGGDRPTEGIGFNFTKPPEPKQPAADSGGATDASELLDFSRVDTSSLAPIEEAAALETGTAAGDDQPGSAAGDGLPVVALEEPDPGNPDVVRFPITLIDESTG